MTWQMIPRWNDHAQSSSPDPPVYLLEVEDEDELAEWVAHHHEELFEEKLKGWFTDPALWPRDRSLKLLQRWCSFELYTVVVDSGESPLEDDEFQE